MSKENSSHYQDAKDFINSLPMSWYPALLIYMAECAYNKKVFVPGGASRIVAKWEGSASENILSATQAELDGANKVIANLKAENEKLRKIAAYVPGGVWITAEERAGFGRAITAKAERGNVWHAKERKEGLH